MPVRTPFSLPRRVLLRGLAGAFALRCTGGRGKRQGSAGSPLVFKQQPLGGEEAPFSAWVAAFEGASVDVEYLPNASDVAHQFYLTALEGGSTDFDVLVADVIWIPEFARAGWVADLSEWFPPASLAQTFLPGPVAAAVVEGRTYAVPWFVDVGLLYYRTDLFPEPPRTPQALIEGVEALRRTHPGMLGYLWQGKQYEGLSCNVFEAMWGHGLSPSIESGLRLDGPEAAEALRYLRSLLVQGVSPPWTTSAAEEESRRPFQAGNAALMRNWPYAYAAANAEGSPVRGRVSVAALPSLESVAGGGPGALGGWLLAVNKHLPKERQAMAAKFVAHLTSVAANRLLALSYARNPARRDAYEDAQLRERAPFIAGLLPFVERAKPRPVTPYYNLLSEVMQSEFSAAVAGIRPPTEALHRAQRQIDRVLGEAQR